MLPDLILKLHKLCPEIEIVIKSGKTADLLDMAKGNDLDLIFTLDQKICNPEWPCAMQRTEEIIFVTLGKERQEKRKIQIQELVQEPFLLTERGAAYHYELERLLSERDLRISPVLEIGNTETIINLLKRGMGVSFLPEFTVREELRKKRLSEIQTDIPTVEMYSQLLYCRNKWVTQEMERFIELVKQYEGQKTKID